jgi:hypothetical protein
VDPIEKLLFGVMGVGLSMGLYVLLYAWSGDQALAGTVAGALIIASIGYGLKDFFND